MNQFKKITAQLKIADSSSAKYKGSLSLIKKEEPLRPYSILGETLKEARLKKRLSQGQVAKMTNFKNAQFISNIERGLALPPSYLMRLFIKIYDLDLELALDALSQDIIKKYRQKFKEEGFEN